MSATGSTAGPPGIVTMSRGSSASHWKGAGVYHGVAEEGVLMRDIATAIGKRLNVPVVAKTPAEAAKHFGFVAPFVSVDNPASGELTKERLGWEPTGVGVLADLEQAELPRA